MPESNLVLVSRPLTDMLVNDMKQLLLGHVVVGAVKTSQMKDEQTLQTGSPVKSTVRINFYEYPHKVSSDANGYHLDTRINTNIFRVRTAFILKGLLTRTGK